MSIHPTKKIAIVGPESTGKSTLSAQLAEHYNTIWVPEFAREYCAQLTEPCTWEDEIKMFHGQIALEDKLMPQANEILICDTMFLTVKIWCEHTFGRAPKEVVNELAKRRYDLYLLMDIDLPWYEDPLRDFPHLREHFMEVWRNELDALGANYTTISGNYGERVKNAVAAIDSYRSIPGS
jgi:NadR type nicotinamide-nucleotide adenylyltransferase